MTEKSDHDLLVEINERLKNHITNVHEHIQDDEAQFAEIKGTLKWQSKIIYVAIGALAIIEVLAKSGMFK